MEYFRDETARRDEDPMEEVLRKNKISRRSNVILFVVLIVGVLVYSLVGGRTSVTAVLDEDGFGVMTLADERLTYAYADVASLELRPQISQLEIGTLRSGEEKNYCCSGVFENAEFGSYQLHANLRIAPYIVARMNDGVVFVFNSTSVEMTEQIFEEIEKRV